MLPPLFFSVRIPTLLAQVWRSLFMKDCDDDLSGCAATSFIIFRLDAMGDVVMTTPLFRELKRAFPGSRCAVVVQQRSRPLLVTNSYIDEILSPPRVNLKCFPQRVNALLAAWLLYWGHLRGRRFDIAISPRWDVDEHLATLLCLLTNAGRRVGYTEKASPLKQRLNRGFEAAFSICLPAGPVRHEVVRNLSIVEALGGTVHDGRLEVRLTERDRASASRLLASIPATTRVIALGIGAASPGRCWPLNRYADCVSQLARQIRFCPVIVCSVGERDMGLGLQRLLNRNCILLCGMPLREVCAVLERCHLFIGNDSGVAHLAAAMKCRTIVISRHPRNGDPNHANSPMRFGPHSDEARVLQPRTGLDDCSDCCKVSLPHCLKSINVGNVVTAARGLLECVPARVCSESTGDSSRQDRRHQLPLMAITSLRHGASPGGDWK